MSSINSLSQMGNNPSDPLHNSDDDNEETIADSFVCCVCLDLLYKPIVLGCGHVSCFWCIHKSMDGLRESHCPICRNPYHHFPTVCEMLHFMLLKMYPVAYNRRAKQVLEEEKQMDCFSPELDAKGLVGTGESKSSQDAHTQSDKPSSACHVGEGKDSVKEGIDDRKGREISIDDVLCPACSEILFRPAVLNCGHVYCEACIVMPEDGIIICKVCQFPHPTDFPKVCLELNSFLEEKFPNEFALRRQNVELMQAQFQHKTSDTCSSPSGSGKKGGKCSGNSEAFMPWWTEHGSKVHMGVGCDNCGMYPIVGDRYRCQDCVEVVGFDLCGDCYNTRSKRPGRFNQQHTPDHRFELVNQPDVLQSIMLQIVGGRLVDSSGAPVLAISAREDGPGAWIAVESGEALPPQTNDSAGGEALQNSHDSGAASDGNNVDSIQADITHDLSTTSMEFTYASEISGVSSAASPAHSDEQDQSESQSTS